jgi:outer membrane protein assembly factor BamB
VRHFVFVAVLGTLMSTTAPLLAALDDEIITESMAQRYGLSRMWVTQSQVDRGQSRLQSVLLRDGMIYAQSNRATLEAIDAETGQKLWTKLVGQPSHPSLLPSACGDLVATINGSTLYVLNRYTGDILYQTTVDGAPGSGPALSTKRAYVPMVSGLIHAYRLEPITDAAKELGKINPLAAGMSDEEKKEAAKKAEEDRRENIRIRQDYIPPLACSSTGRVLVAPVVTVQNRDEEFVTWGTDRGYLYVGRIDRRGESAFQAKYRLNTNGVFNNPPAYLPPDPKVVGDSGVIYGGSTDGFVYALVERSGDLQWKFATSEPIIDSPVVIEDRVYATTELGSIFCLFSV